MYRTILVGTDGSPTATEAVDAAARLAASLGSQLHVLSVADDADIGRRILAEADARARGFDVVCSAHLTSGHPGRAIVECATTVGADLVVVGDKGMHGVNRLLTGSVPNFVAHNAPCSVLLVDSTRRAEPDGHDSTPAA